jgi:hypothetical protein
VDVERFNRRYVLIAVVGAAGLALGVDKFVLSDGLTTPSSASASVAPSAEAKPAAKAHQQDMAKSASPAMKLEVYRKTNETKAPVAQTPRDAMKHQGWISTSSAKDGAATKTVAPMYKDVFELGGVAGDSVRLRREGDKGELKRGRILRVGETVNWGGDSNVVLTVVSISQDNRSIVIDVNGERREVRLSTEQHKDK